MVEMNLGRVGEYIKEFPWRSGQDIAFFYDAEDVMLADYLREILEEIRKVPGLRSVVQEFEFRGRPFRCLWVTGKNRVCRWGPTETGKGSGVKMLGPILTQGVKIVWVDVQRYSEQTGESEEDGVVLVGLSSGVGGVELLRNRENDREERRDV